MLLAIYNKEYVEASPKSEAICPFCCGEVIPKCGDIKIWHWAHKSQCEFETETETEWHINWKQYAKNQGCVIEKGFDRHIADIYVPENKIIEVQHSQISTDEILSRCEHYSTKNIQINWIFDYAAKNAEDHLLYTPIKETLFKLKQKWAKKNIIALFDTEGYPKYGRVYLDDGVFVNTDYTEVPDYYFEYSWKDKVLFEVKKMYENGNGWGRRIKISKVFGIDTFKGASVGKSALYRKHNPN